MTRFQRINLMIGAALLALIATAATTRAQTFEEAVVANTSIALELCLRPGVPNEARAQLFQSAGFGVRIQSQSVGDITYEFAAPADTVSAVFYYGQMPEYCEVATNHLGVTAAAAIIDAVIPRLYPGFVRKVSVGPVNAAGQAAQCVRYEDPTNPIGLVIGTVPNGDNETCRDDGTTLFYSAYRV